MPAKPGFITNGELCVRKYSEIKLFAGAVSHNEPGPVTKHERPLWPGYASSTLLFCLATRRCMNLAPSFSQCLEQASVYAVQASSEEKRVTPDISHTGTRPTVANWVRPCLSSGVFC